jgi:hypothetical protein
MSTPTLLRTALAAARNCKVDWVSALLLADGLIVPMIVVSALPPRAHDRIWVNLLAR